MKKILSKTKMKFQQSWLIIHSIHNVNKASLMMGSLKENIDYSPLKLKLKTYLFQSKVCTILTRLHLEWPIVLIPVIELLTLFTLTFPHAHITLSLSIFLSSTHAHLCKHNEKADRTELGRHNLWLMHWVVWLTSIIFIMLNFLSFSVSQIMFSLSGWCMGQTYIL